MNKIRFSTILTIFVTLAIFLASCGDSTGWGAAAPAAPSATPTSAGTPLTPPTVDPALTQTGAPTAGPTTTPLAAPSAVGTVTMLPSLFTPTGAPSETPTTIQSPTAGLPPVAATTPAPIIVVTSTQSPAAPATAFGCPAAVPASTNPTPLNADDNKALTLGSGFYDVEDTRGNDIKPDGTGNHRFYVLYVAPGDTFNLPPYSDENGRRRVWQFTGTPSPDGALCEVLREATDFVGQKVGTSTTVWFFDTLMLNNGVQ